LSKHAKILVLGAGLIGGVVAEELARSGAEVLVGDRETRKIPGCKYLKMDFADHDSLIKIMSGGYDVVASAVPGRFGFGVMEAAVKAGVDLVDVSFGDGNPLALMEKAKRAGIIIVPDCGVAPGLSNLLVGIGMTKVEKPDETHIKVGGLPQKPKPPLNYRIVFSAEAVVDEYTRKARIVKNGKVTEVDALSGLELFEFPGIGKLECFYTDGLRTLIDTLKLKQMDEKTIRYPGHADKVKALVEAGLFEPEPVVLGVRPRDFMEAFLSSKLRMGKNERDITLLEVEVKGESETVRYRMLDKFDEKNNITSMARTTGYPLAVVSMMVAEKRVGQKGVVPLEILGSDKTIPKLVLDELRKRNVRIEEEKLKNELR
jgi:lysine 6-dehydrogenase